MSISKQGEGLCISLNDDGVLRFLSKRGVINFYRCTRNHVTLNSLTKNVFFEKMTWEKSKTKFATYSDSDPDGRILIWDVVTGRNQELLSYLEGAKVASWSPDGKRLAVWSKSESDSDSWLDSDEDSDMFDSDSDLWSESESENEDSSDYETVQLQIWEVETGSCSRVLQEFEGEIADVKWSQDGKKIVTQIQTDVEESMEIADSGYEVTFTVQKKKTGMDRLGGRDGEVSGAGG
uniref:Translation initiation factor beta propellor-like domain-containing protein n=1 Tax=Guillardia theta TaxID=55529 RepID=A0A7S4JAJ4_GUITH